MIAPARHIPDSHRDLVDRPLIASLAITLSDGTPQVTPVWFHVEDGYFYVNTAKGRVKEKALARHPYAALLVIDPSDPYRYLAVRGPVVEASEAEGRAHINLLSKRYTGNAVFRSNSPNEVRIRYKIAPAFILAEG